MKGMFKFSVSYFVRSPLINLYERDLLSSVLTYKRKFVLNPQGTDWDEDEERERGRRDRGVVEGKKYPLG